MPIARCLFCFILLVVAGLGCGVQPATRVSRGDIVGEYMLTPFVKPDDVPDRLFVRAVAFLVLTPDGTAIQFRYDPKRLEMIRTEEAWRLTEIEGEPRVNIGGRGFPIVGTLPRLLLHIDPDSPLYYEKVR